MTAILKVHLPGVRRKLIHRPAESFVGFKHEETCSMPLLFRGLRELRWRVVLAMN